MATTTNQNQHNKGISSISLNNLVPITYSNGQTGVSLLSRLNQTQNVDPKTRRHSLYSLANVNPISQVLSVLGHLLLYIIIKSLLSFLFQSYLYMDAAADRRLFFFYIFKKKKRAGTEAINHRRVVVDGLLLLPLPTSTST